VEQAGAFRSLWRLASWRPMEIFFGGRIENEGYTGDDREDVLGRTERIFCRRQT
jgi:hypothetical protein